MNTNQPSRIHRIGLFLLALVMIAPGWAVAEEPTPEQVVGALTELRTQLEWPGLTLKEAAVNLKTPEEAFRFVRDEVVFVNYRGSYADPAATLRTRVANATDKAYLLAMLLQEMGVRARMARADWPDDAMPHQGPGSDRKLPALAKLAELLGVDVTEAGSPDGLTDEQFDALTKEIADSASLIEAWLTGRGQERLITGTPDAALVPPTRTDPKWVWVQALVDGEWTNLDPVLPDQARPDTFEAPFGFMPVGVAVRLEAVTASTGESTAVLEWRGPISHLLGYDVQISYYPEGNELAAADEPETVARWITQLAAGPLVVPGKLFTPSGGPGKDEAPAEQPAGGGGFGGLGNLMGGEPEATSASSPGCDYLRLMIEIDDSEDPETGKVVLERIVQYTGPGSDPQELVAFHRIGIGMAFVPPRVAEARAVDEIIAAHHFRWAVETDNADMLATPRGYSTRTTRVLNSLLFLKVLATDPEMPLSWQGPAVFVETGQLRAFGEEVFFVSRLDTLQEAFAPGPDATRSQRVEWGLATAAVEAHLLGGESVNQDLLAHGDSLRHLHKDQTDQGVSGDLIEEVMIADGIVLTSDSASQSLWALRTTGDLLAIYIDKPSDLAAKGAGARARSRAAGRAYASLGDGAMAVLGGPSGMLVSVLHRYFEELAEAYYKAASVLDDLATTIETGDDSHMDGSQDDYFNDLGRHLVNAMARGGVEGWAQSVIGAGAGHALGTSAGTRYGGRSMTDRVIDGLISTNLSLPEESPIFPTLMESAMDAVTLPIE